MASFIASEFKTLCRDFTGAWKAGATDDVSYFIHICLVWRFYEWIKFLRSFYIHIR